MSETGDRQQADAGATLLEMLVVVAILGLVSTLVLPSLSNAYARAKAHALQAALTSDLRDAHANAIRTQTAVAFDAEADGRGYRIGEREVRFPAGTTLDADPAEIVFYPDGVDAQGRITLHPPALPALSVLVLSPSGALETTP